MNKLVFKEQLSLVDAAPSENNCAGFRLSSRKTWGKKISFCLSLPFLNIYTALFYCDKHKMRRKKKTKRGENQHSLSLRSVFAKTTHALYDKANKWCQIKVAKGSAIHTCRLCVLEREQKNLPNVIPLWRYKSEQSQCSAHTMGLPRSL